MAEPVRRVMPGDVVRLVSPCSPPDAQRVERGMEMLRSWGLRPEIGSPLTTGRRPAGTAEERAAELASALACPDVAAVFVTRAGDGAADVLPLVDFSALDRRPVPLCGFSDVTFLHARIAQLCGRPSFHTPELAWNSRLNGDPSARGLRNLLMSEPDVLRAAGGAQRNRGPEVTGILHGGNLSVLARTDPPSSAASSPTILFLEELAESPESIARLLAELDLRGHTRSTVGIVFGQFVDCGDVDAVTEVLDAWAAKIADTVMYGLPVGHGTDQMSLPLNWPVTVDPRHGTLRCEQPPTRVQPL